MTILRATLLAALTSILLVPTAPAQQPAQTPIRVAIVGLTHDHVRGFFGTLPSHPEVQLVGISEPNAALRAQYIASTHLPAALFFPTEAAMLQATHPQAILVYTSIAGHRAAIEAAAPLHIAAMVEKPLATTYADALAIEQLARQYNIPVLTNYETTWYANNTAAHTMLERGDIGDLRKLVVHDGHRGPKEIGVGPDFLSWLTDPTQNGGGALFDFGCYGVDLSTWFHHGEAPLTVTAVTLHIKPSVYPNVDDDSTIVLTYPHSQSIIQGSWNWPFDRKDMEVYGATGYIDTVYVDTQHTDQLRLRLPNQPTEHSQTAPPLTTPQDNSLNYLAAVLNHTLTPHADLTSLDTNVTVVRILDAARESARTGRTITLAAESNSTLQSLVEEDQRLRTGNQMTKAERANIALTDINRQTAVKQMIAGNQLNTPRDYRSAALILQHSLISDDYLLAHSLAILAASKGDETALWLSAATLDRYLTAIKQPQIYGTQFLHPYQTKPWTQAPYTTNLVTDELRKEFGVPPLAEQQNQLDTFNQPKATR